MHTFDDNTVSDLYKDTYGVRPGQAFWSAWAESTDDGKQEIGMGRDLIALQKQFGQAAQLTFRDTSAEFERDDVKA
mgnify:CR=1 FL=1